MVFLRQKFAHINDFFCTFGFADYRLLGNVAQWYFTFAPVLAKNYHVVMFDLKSHGKSEKGKGGFDLKKMAEDVLGLMNALEIEKAHLVGYSFGAQIALKFAVIFPDRCNQLILLESPSPKHSMVYQVMEEQNLKTLEEVKQQLPDIVMGKVKNQMVGEGKVSRGKTRVLNSIMAVFKHLCWETTLIEDLDREEEFENEDLLMIASDTLLLYGSESDCLDEANNLAKWIPSNHYLLKEGGHWYPLENPVEVAEDVNNFLFKTSKSIFSQIKAL